MSRFRIHVRDRRSRWIGEVLPPACPLPKELSRRLPPGAKLSVGGASSAREGLVLERDDAEWRDAHADDFPYGFRCWFCEPSLQLAVFRSQGEVLQ